MKISDLAKKIMEKFPNVSTDEEVFPSGKVWLDIRFGSECFTVESYTDGDIGVSRLNKDAAFDAGHDKVFKDPSDVFEYLTLAISQYEKNVKQE